jgi:hypothetical protein
MIDHGLIGYLQFATILLHSFAKGHCQKFKCSHTDYTRARESSCPLPIPKLKIRETVLTTQAMEAIETDSWRE